MAAHCEESLKQRADKDAAESLPVSPRLILVSVWAFVVVLLAVASPADAANLQRPFLEPFGPSEQPTFSNHQLLAVDSGTGDVLVGQRTGTTGNAITGTISRFHADGTPAPFAKLGNNTIDGKAGPGGMPCAQEPESCDRTPQEYLEVRDYGVQQIAVDPATGNILVTEGGLASRSEESIALVNVFSSDGMYLGQITSSSEGSVERACGAVVSPDGVVYIAGKFAGTTGIAEYVPSGNPPLDLSAKAFIPIDSGLAQVLCHMALGSSASANSIFIATGSSITERVWKVSTVSGEAHVFVEGAGTVVAVDPTTGNLLAGSRESEALEYASSGEVAGSVLSRLVTGGSRLGDFAVNSAGQVYAMKLIESHDVSVYGRPAVVPSVVAAPASSVGATTATLSGTINPEGLEVTNCVFEYGIDDGYGQSVPCEGTLSPPDASDHPVEAHVEGLSANGVTYHFRIAATNENGTEQSADRTFTTLNRVETKPAQATGVDTALLKGIVRPEGISFGECFFEYGIATNPGYEHSVQCSPEAGSIPTGADEVEVTASINGLVEGTRYRVRLRGANSEGPQIGDELPFETFGSPRISGLGAREATQTSALLEADVNPRGFGTTYYFEWGATSSYDHRLPATPEAIGVGQDPVRVTAELSGLAAGSTYHYRVVAESRGSQEVSADEIVETLNACGLPEGRCFELVSPRSVGPVASPGETVASLELKFQASPGSGAVAYASTPGLPGTTKGAEVLYRGIRGPDGWGSQQLSGPITARNERSDTGSNSSVTAMLSEDLSCGVTESWQPLTADPSMRLVYEEGGANLYRLDPDGGFTPITTTTPENPALRSPGYYVLAGASADCSVVAFTSAYLYPGIPGVGQFRTYEWREGVLRNLDSVPAASGEAPTEGPQDEAGQLQEVKVSDDGTRVFFSGERLTSPKPAEINRRGVFVREDGSATRDISLSETASTPDTGASLQWVTRDGSRAFFTANAGIAANGASSGGIDLYEYDFNKPEGERLTDLTVDEDPGGANVATVIGASTDGTHVYFLAQGQLLPGRGNTLAQNQQAGDYSVYGLVGGELSYVGTVEKNRPIAQVSPDGRFLLFESRADVTGYQSGGAGEAYLYDSEGSSEGAVCLSCRADGQLSVASPEFEVLASGNRAANLLHPPRIISGPEGAPRAVFSSLDSLAPGAIEGETNLYEWSHGQIFLLTSEPAGSRVAEKAESVFFAGASADASDMYLTTPQTLSWEDGDGRNSIYDARIGGGFPEPGPPAPPCNPDAEGSCQAPTQTSPGTPNAASSTFVGPGNVKPKPHKNKHKKKHKQKHKKKHKHHKHGKGKPNHDQGAGK